MRSTFALVEDGTARISLFTEEGVLRRGRDGVWLTRARSNDDLIDTGELCGCRKIYGDTGEYSAILEEALAALADRARAPQGSGAVRRSASRPNRRQEGSCSSRLVSQG